MTNPIAELAAGAFLVFYAKTIAVVLVALFVYLRLADRTRHLPATVSFAVDPYEVAYLRGGINETARTAIVGLVERGFLALEDDAPGPRTSASGGWRALVRSSRHPSPGELSALEREVHDWFQEPQTVRDLFRGEKPARLTTFCLPFQERLEREQMLRRDPAPLWLGMGAAALVIAGIGALRLAVGVAREKPVGFLVLMGLAGLALVLALGLGSNTRPSARGRAFLAKLRAGVESGAEPHASWVLAAAVVGPSILAGTELAGLGGEFRKATRSAAAGCGAGWVGGDGGGGGSGDGGGGGCGGCGGCGS
jgi:uncharacterized protein (TIGR04222 family)